MAKVEADKVKILIEPQVIKTYSPPPIASRGPIHYTPSRNIDPNAPSNLVDNSILIKEDVRIALMESIARSLRSDYRVPDRMIIGSNEYDITKNLYEIEGYITFSAWQRPSLLRVIRMKMKHNSFIITKNDKVQLALLRIVNDCISTAATFPSLIEVNDTTYRTNCSYAPGSSNPPKEGWLNLTVDLNYLPIANLRLEEDKTILAH